VEKIKQVQNDVLGRSAEDQDSWVTEQTGARFAGRFFIGKAGEKVAGYVTESSHYGFKSPIRFFVALTPEFQVRGVEVVGHEEDPGLGAEITRPQFKNQFAGRAASVLPALEITKDPMPAGRKAAVLARDTMPYEAWVKAHDPGQTKIYAVTGATISSRALADGVKEAVAHLKYRLGILQGVTP
jgi:electron transport complex protein RnfG